MNIENLHKIITRYEAQYNEINNEDNNEKFKLKAVECFQQEWFSPNNEGLPFSVLFSKAKRESSVLIDNSTVSPANGIVKMAELEEAEVKRLFCEILFAEDNGDLAVRQQHMEEFLEGIEKVRLNHFPACWKYTQDRHAVSCYLALFAPKKNYIYKYTHAESFAKYIEYGKNIGSGNNFSLANYYEMCDLVVEALQEHPTLLKAYHELLIDGYYRDDSLHMLAFDVIYCASTYNLFTGLQHKAKKEAIKAYRLEKLRQAEAEKIQKEIEEIEAQIQALDIQLDLYRSINLVGVQVNEKHYGVGTVVAQNVNTIKVAFADGERAYIVNKKYTMRPTFEDDVQIVEAMTDYEQKMKQRKSLENQLRKFA
ncbi:hypothetical protein [Paenibacillus sp.]